MIDRPLYLAELSRWKETDVIKVVTGVRRCGKSTLLWLFSEQLKRQGVPSANIISVNMEDYLNFELRDPKVFHQYVLDHVATQGTTYLFVDEVQNIDDFPRVIDSLYLRKDLDIYITGSNAYMLSGQLATLLSGRYIQIDMLPLSFKEYASWADAGRPVSELFKQYMETTSFPYATELAKDSQAVDTYLDGIYQSVMLKDVIGRLPNANTMVIESILRFLFSVVGSQVSTKKIADTLTSQGRKLDSYTVEKYLTTFLDSYLFYQAKRYDIKGKSHLKTLEKYYCVDIGLRYLLLGRKNLDIGHMLENVVYLELLRRNQKVYIGKVQDMEVDFVTMDSQTMAYYQVSASVRDPNTLERELRALRAIKDNYPKILLTLDEDPDADYDGIQKVNVLQWLLR